MLLLLFIASVQDFGFVGFDQNTIIITVLCYTYKQQLCVFKHNPHEDFDCSPTKSGCSGVICRLLQLNLFNDDIGIITTLNLTCQSDCPIVIF